MTTAPHYLIGIDLGTTHTVAAYAELAHGTAHKLELFPIEQSIKPGQVAARPLLPSARYHAAPAELSDTDTALPWPPTEPPQDHRPVVGELARLLGAKSRGRLIMSAKSWLSHAGADRTAAILPWGAPEDVPKISPVDASASYLRHVRSAWNAQHPEAPLERQDLVVTVPASFDEAARALTLEAARLAGLPKLRLLEEPQAVCYDWLWQHRKTLQKELDGVRLLLVCDVGGGTTDLTLIKVEPGADEPKLTRIAVGNHLMLGGDNIDLTLAHLAEQRMLGGDKRLSSAELSQLVEQCRLAKERLLADVAPDTATVTLLGAGSRLIGAARSVELDRDEVHRMVLDGFFPRVGLHEHPDRKRSGVVEFGLPYAADPAISKHLAAFLSQHRTTAAEALGSNSETPVPDALLLNGGVFRSPVIVRRIVEQMAEWGGQAPKVLRNERPDQAVAYGAVAYGLARRGHAIQRIGGGSARSYFLLVDTGADQAQRGVCILPRGTEEGREVVLAERTFSLRLGQPVRFHLASSSGDMRYQPGELAEIDEERFQNLPPLAVAFDRDSAQGGQEQAVRIAAALTEIGTLDLQCVAVDDPEKRWNIEFQLRRGAAQPVLEARRHPRLDEALEKIRLVFGKKTKTADPKAIKGLRSELEKSLGGRGDWETPLLRELFGALLEGLPHRRRSADHERVWLSLVGYCLRPGFGYPLDDWRVEQVFAVYGQGLQFVNEPQNWAEWWTLWRRIAGGLDAAAQTAVFHDLAEIINPDTAKRGNNVTLAKKRGYEDMVRLAAVLERLPAANKAELGGWLLHRLEKSSEPMESWWALGRIGARVPFHGSAHNVVPVATVERWLETVMGRDFRKEPHPGFAAALLGRMSGDRERDLEPATRHRLIDKLRAAKAPESWISMVSEVKELTEADEQRIFGEALPPGLKLIG
ncbi:Molecular chaperone DnaK (HSP70) [Methylomagnum ishizawai]|uniref:Molecular chaperone DnaK (HSP70) n=1 Tax=Methylomagnum ishizawai TaxID=1760988 RepID=A0A1Y6D0B8_9GAMM|nr:Hsp70 family protein [Methylomagnum ishizawai]SMF95890.1 Molecular chaperone DnaK (HSP70) [Methylomagnum ishizawai]